ncbi:MAG TPA: DUF5335 family protein [Acidimicrobiia bacterium]|nr:DUF5335 family protein [Acidimicrobiia bacterium]
MSTTTQLPIESMGEFAARLPQAGTVDVTIELIGDDIGDQIQVERLPWHALIYDDREKILELSVGARGRSREIVFRHEIHEPVTVWFEEDAGTVRSMSIEHADGTHTIVRFLEHRAIEAGA